MIIITDLLMSTRTILGVFLTQLHVGEINVLPSSNFLLLLLIIYDPHATQKASVGMYSGCM